MSNILAIIFEQQGMLNHLMGRIAQGKVSEKETIKPSYADVPSQEREDRSKSRARIRKQFNVLVYPKENQTLDQTKKYIQSKIKPSSINVKINGVKNIRKCGIVINTPFEDDVD
ncbi:hypothetical protein AVEN_268255-1 [Araneus ventricosus]|uniref:Uncharacterized protein n=1 Tax=Araneus ventricosus TaxID=182803 RepID=A0A4Y2C200_ARAVE|nr:hypothetical protein AVEN_268255-1 [Araneus ventricosus]